MLRNTESHGEAGETAMNDQEQTRLFEEIAEIKQLLKDRPTRDEVTETIKRDMTVYTTSVKAEIESLVNLVGELRTVFSNMVLSAAKNEQRQAGIEKENRETQILLSGLESRFKDFFSYMEARQDQTKANTEAIKAISARLTEDHERHDVQIEKIKENIAYTQVLAGSEFMAITGRNPYSPDTTRNLKNILVEFEEQKQLVAERFDAQSAMIQGAVKGINELTTAQEKQSRDIADLKSKDTLLSYIGKQVLPERARKMLATPAAVRVIVSIGGIFLSSEVAQNPLIQQLLAALFNVGG